MRRLVFALVLAAALVPTSGAEPEAPLGGLYLQAMVDPMKTSIYIGSVRLITGPFARDGDTFEASYEAKVFPFFFYNETGRIVFRLSEPVLRRLVRGETVAFSGEAVNHRHKQRSIEIRAEPQDASHGKIKVNITADGIKLIFHGVYRFTGLE